MKINIDYIFPIIILTVIVLTIIFNNKTPTTTSNNNVIIPPKHVTEFVRTLDTKDSKENDNKISIIHKESGDKLDLLSFNNYLLLPDGEKSLPTKKNSAGEFVPIWEIKHYKKDYIFDPSIDIGAYSGFVVGNFENSNRTRNFDVGLRISPLKIYNTFSADILISPQNIGIGASFYPSPLIYGSWMSHLGIGGGRVMDYENKDFHNIIYFSFSCNF